MWYNSYLYRPVLYTDDLAKLLPDNKSNSLAGAGEGRGCTKYTKGVAYEMGEHSRHGLIPSTGEGGNHHEHR